MDLELRSLSLLHSPWGPALPEALISPTGPGGEEAETASPRAGLPTEQPSPPHPFFHQLTRAPFSPLDPGKPGNPRDPWGKWRRKKLNGQKREGPRKGQREAEVVVEAWCGRPGLWPSNPCCSLGLCATSSLDPTALSACTSCSRVSGKGKGGGGIMSPWGPGVQDSQADQEHPACPVEGQQAIRSTRSHDTSPSLENPTLKHRSQPPPSNMPHQTSSPSAPTSWAAWLL